MIIDPTRSGAANLRSSLGGTPPRRSPMMLAILLAAAILGGCGEADEPSELTKQGIAFDDVPEPVRDAARKALPAGVKLDEAWKNLDRDAKLHSYELRGRNAADGKIREVRVSPSGGILEME